MLTALVMLLQSCWFADEKPVPENIGWVHSEQEGAKIILFDAETYEEFRRVRFTPHLVGGAHRFEIDPMGRIWSGYDQEYVGPTWTDVIRGRFRIRDEVTIRDSLGDEIALIEDPCTSPRGGIAFVAGMAFIGCEESGTRATVVAVDIETLAVVERFSMSPPEYDLLERALLFSTVEASDNAVFVSMTGKPPSDFEHDHIHGAIVSTTIAVIDPWEMQIRGYVELPPGSRVNDMQHVDGLTWLFNSYSHVTAGPERVDVHVLDPVSVEVVDSFNLPKAYPVWAFVRDRSMYVFHNANGAMGGYGNFEEPAFPLDPETDGPEISVSRIDMGTMQMEYRKFEVDTRGNQEDVFYSWIQHAAPGPAGWCVAFFGGEENGGLYCEQDDGVFRQVIQLERAVGVLFP